MVKKKSNLSLFSTLVGQINSQPSSSTTGEYHLIDNEYFAAFNTLDDIEQFHNKLIENQSSNNNEEQQQQQQDDDDQDIDMKTFAQQYLIDLPEPMTTTTTTTETVSTNSKRQRRNIRDLPQSSNFIFMSDDDHGNIFDSVKDKKISSRSKRIAYEDMSSILLTLDIKQKRKKHSESTIVMELAEPSIIKNEPIEPEQLVITHVIEAKDEPVEINVIPTGPMGFGTAEYFGDLDNYVQNIHRSCPTNVSIVDPLLPSSSRPKRIRKRKRLYIEESESIIKPKRIRKKRTPINLNPTLLTDAEIEQQFGERLSPTIKSEINEDIQQIVVETQSIPQTPIEKARAKLINALERGHGPDTFILKIRSRESKMIEVELAIYGTADWYSHRAKILSKIEEALRSLRVSWTKIDIHVDDFDIQICTSPQTVSAQPSTSLNNNTSWFLKALSDSGPLIVHIYDRKHPQQRAFTKCPCPQCNSSNEYQSSLPITINIDPIKPSNRRLLPPTILRKTSQTISSLYNIHTKFFQELISQYGTNTISTVTQCVLDLTLITSVHSSLGNLFESNDNYETKYQQIIDPLKYTENQIISKSLNEPDILTFYKIIKQNKANIRSAQSMRNIIFSNLNKTISNRRSIFKRHRNHTSTNEHTKAHFTPIIELKPILGGPTTTTTTITTTNDESIRKITKIISTNTIQKDAQRINTITTQEITPRVIRLLTSNSIRLVTPTTPLVPKQINIIKPIPTSSSSTTPAIKLSNPILISNKSQQPSIK